MTASHGQILTCCNLLFVFKNVASVSVYPSAKQASEVRSYFISFCSQPATGIEFRSCTVINLSAIPIDKALFKILCVQSLSWVYHKRANTHRFAPNATDVRFLRPFLSNSLFLSSKIMDFKIYDCWARALASTTFVLHCVNFCEHIRPHFSQQSTYVCAEQCQNEHLDREGAFKSCLITSMSPFSRWIKRSLRCGTFWTQMSIKTSNNNSEPV